MIYPKNIHISGFHTGHVQGIAVDSRREYIYCSFTTCLVKADRTGRVIGTVRGLLGHLGCIAFNEADGRIYGSLEYKHDMIGRNILQKSGTDSDVRDGFYTAIFDVDRIDRPDMDAETSGIMTAVWLGEVLADYSAPEHRYGCSGIDGMTFAPAPGEIDGKLYLYTAYGVYSDTQRTDNDHQVLLRYDTDAWHQWEAPLQQASMHTQGPDAPDGKYFVYTGNTRYGIQNLEYAAEYGCMFAAVYPGEKPAFPNKPMYAIDLRKKAEHVPLRGLSERGDTLPLRDFGKPHTETGIWGMDFPYGMTGMISCGNDIFYFSHDFRSETGFGTDIGLYRFDGTGTFLAVTDDSFSRTEGNNTMLMIASDIHGSAVWCEKMLKAFEESGAERLVLLGDILYHGPRNDLPDGYAPKRVIEMLTPYADKILCVRGNCDTDVDQMVLNFPVLAEYAVLFVNGQTIYATHGHKYGPDTPPPLREGDILLCGHTHVPADEMRGGFRYVNPGSVSIPKEGSSHRVLLLDENGFRPLSLEDVK